MIGKSDKHRYFMSSENPVFTRNTTTPKVPRQDEPERHRQQRQAKLNQADK